jgi:acetamidase/formamidase
MTHHHFEPPTYWNSFGSHPPVLRIRPGDTVITSTVDASGLDQLEQPVAQGSNPETGPFYVEDAAPGDTLVVYLDALGPNRLTGWSRDVLAPHVLEAGAVRGLPESAIIQWDIAPDGRTACLPAGAPPNRLDQVAFPLHPMLGCLGVAPEDGQAISSSTSGPYGGNMDYHGVTAAATLYFPVFVPGALLHLGDGHALQGDGEIVGTGIETSFKVQFTVGLLKRHLIRWPRGENADYIFTLGNARPMEQALQHATTEMLAWLQTDYNLDVRGASLLLGMCVEYEVGNVFDPAYTMVCKLPKSILSELKAV